MGTTKRTLFILAAVVWNIGGIMLFLSGYELIQQSIALRSGVVWPWVFTGCGILLGIFQALTLFTHSCRKNLQRIQELEDPRIWQFFRPGFFLALAVMISSGILLDHFSRGKYFFMLAVAAVDITLTISLLGSSYIFWTECFPGDQ
jgi:hypothetical protein